MPQEDGTKTPVKPFKAYDPGFVHVDVKYLPQMPDEDHRQYLFAAIDRATRWVYVELLQDKSAASAGGFLTRLIDKAPFTITKVLTDNGKCQVPDDYEDFFEGSLWIPDWSKRTTVGSTMTDDGTGSLFSTRTENYTTPLWLAEKANLHKIS